MKHSELIRSLRKKYRNRSLGVELTNSCNLSCPLCSTGSGTNKKKKGMMKLEKFIKFMEACHPVFDTVIFQGSGEPTLHPQFMDFVECAVKFKKITTVSTNGTRIEDPERLVKSGLYRICFDIEGVTQSQHEIYRVGADLEAILNGIKELVRERKRQRSVFPEIYVDTLISRHNENDYDELIKMARGLGVDGVHLSPIIDDLFKTADWLPVGEKFKPVKLDAAAECHFKQFAAGILSYDGEVQLCCMTPHHDKPIIKVNAFQESDILEKMNSEQFFKMTKNAGNYDFCRSCFLPNHKINCERKIFKMHLPGKVMAFRRYPYLKLMLSRIGYPY